MRLEFARIFFSKNTQLSNLRKILRVGAELFNADRRTNEGIDRSEEVNSSF
jgi:hypothetical protein